MNENIADHNCNQLGCPQCWINELKLKIKKLEKENLELKRELKHAKLKKSGYNYGEFYD